jgi:hypothetical protein
MSRFVDRGAIAAAWVGVGLAVTVGVSFMLVIPIEFLVAPFALLGGLLIGYYANARSDRAGGPWRRILANALLAGLATGITFALLYLGVKALFFLADNGYRDESSGGPLACESGPDCVYQRYLAIGRGPAFEEAGVTDLDSFTQLYWSEQLSTAGLHLVLATGGALGGAFVFGMTNRRRPDESAPPDATGARPA